ncbi:MFS transporter [Ruegeria halocynthiae]|uniref:MFS transporter n=1 Tax=Ruegeria halocynthiae TaxID=985054 RepID=UPI000567CB12|nr:MFS transporter [Ruegeria halocynthiae]
MTDAQIQQGHRFRLAKNGLPASLVLAAVQMSAILYSGLSPVIITGLTQTGDFTTETGGYVFAINMLGNTLGGLGMATIVQRINWRIAMVSLLLMMMAMDAASILWGGQQSLFALRALHGLASGALVAVALTIIARTKRPDRVLALGTALLVSLGGFFTIALTKFLPDYSIDTVWTILIVVSGIVLLLLPLLGEYPPIPYKHTDVKQQRASILYIVLALVAIILFQAGNMTAYVYSIELGLNHQFSQSFTGTVVGLSLWAGALGAVVIAWWSTRMGRMLPVLVLLVVMTCAVSLLLVPQEAAFAVSLFGASICYAMVFPYLMAIASEMDNTGTIAAIGSFCASFGIAAGPGFAAVLLGDGAYGRVVLFAAGSLAASGLIALLPARMLDRQNLKSRVRW